MNKKQLKKHEVIIQQRRRFYEASDSLQKMQKRIKPFVKHRKFKKYSTAGKWVDGTNFFPKQR